jgi:hypothetical protein
MRIYLSIFAVTDEAKKTRTLEALQNSFVKEALTDGNQLFDGSAFVDYASIYDEIEKSDIVAAFIDEYWLSSTWKAIELWYAAGLSAENESNFIGSPLNCYLYCKSPERTIIKSILGHDNVNLFDGTYRDFCMKMNKT